MARIVIADDNPSVRYLISILADKAGHTVVGEAGNGRDAVDICMSMKPELLIVEFELPIMSGCSVIAELTNRLPGLKFVICTGSIEKLKHVDAIKVGNIPVLGKPFDNNKLIELMAMVLDR